MQIVPLLYGPRPTLKNVYMIHFFMSTSSVVGPAPCKKIRRGNIQTRGGSTTVRSRKDVTNQSGRISLWNSEREEYLKRKRYAQKESLSLQVKRGQPSIQSFQTSLFALGEINQIIRYSTLSSSLHEVQAPQLYLDHKHDPQIILKKKKLQWLPPQA